MLHGHTSTAKRLVRAFLEAKTAPSRSRVTAVTAHEPSTSGVTPHAAESETNLTADAPNNATSPGGGGGDDDITVTATGSDVPLAPNGSAVGGVEGSGGKPQPRKTSGGGGGKPAAVALKDNNGGGFVEKVVEDGGGSATTSVAGESRDGGQSSGRGEGGDGDMSEATNSSLGVTEAVLGRRASEAGVAVSGGACFARHARNFSEAPHLTSLEPQNPFLY